jgi:lysozyme
MRAPLILPVLRYDVINLSEGDSQTSVEKWLSIPGLDAVIHRSSMGTDGSDKAYKNRAVAAMRADYKWGAYHFLRQEGNGQEQATWFIKTLTKSSDHPSAVLLVIDAEYLKGTNSPHPTLTQVVDCLKKVHELTGKYPGIYTGQDFLWEQFNKAQYDSATRNLLQKNTWLWVARYSASYTKLNWPVVILPPWDKWTLWQVSDDKNPTPMFEGMNAEINVFKGERSDLERFWDEHSWDYKLKAPLD